MLLSGDASGVFLQHNNTNPIATPVTSTDDATITMYINVVGLIAPFTAIKTEIRVIPKGTL